MIIKGTIVCDGMCTGCILDEYIGDDENCRYICGDLEDKYNVKNIGIEEDIDKGVNKDKIKESIKNKSEDEIIDIIINLQTGVESFRNRIVDLAQQNNILNNREEKSKRIIQQKYDEGFNNGTRQGYDEGNEEGYVVGHEKGLDKGKEDGEHNGYHSGYEDGYEDSKNGVESQV